MGSREGAATWIDASGKFWLFGGNGVANSEFTVNVYNDLWQITP